MTAAAIASWKILMARASAPISSPRAAWGTSTFSAPSATRLMVEVICDSGRATERAMISTPSTITIMATPPRQVSTNDSVRLVAVSRAICLARSA